METSKTHAPFLHSPPPRGVFRDRHGRNRALHQLRPLHGAGGARVLPLDRHERDDAGRRADDQLAAGAGVASFFSPCAFPLRVTLLAREVGTDGNAADDHDGGGGGSAPARGVQFATALAAGAAVFLVIVGVGIGVGGGALFSQVTFTSTAGIVLRIIMGVLLVLLGLIQLGVIPVPLHAVQAVSRPLLQQQAETRRSAPLAGGALFGFGYLLAGFG